MDNFKENAFYIVRNAHINKLLTDLENTKKLLEELKEECEEFFPEPDNMFQALCDILLNPKNSKELTMADIIYSQIEDMIEIDEAVNNNTVKIIPLDENIAIKELIHTIKLLKDKETISKPPQPSNAIKNEGTYWYYLVNAGTDENKLKYYITNKTGLCFYIDADLNIISDAVSILINYNAIAESLKKAINGSKKDIDNIYTLFNQFHKLHKSNLKENDNIEKIHDIICDKLGIALIGNSSFLESLNIPVYSNILARVNRNQTYQQINQDGFDTKPTLVIDNSNPNACKLYLKDYEIIRLEEYSVMLSYMPKQNLILNTDTNTGEIKINIKKR